MCVSRYACYLVRVKALGISQSGATHFVVCGIVCGGGVQKGTMLLAKLSAGFKSLPLLPTRKLGPCHADSWVGGFV